MIDDCLCVKERVKEWGGVTIQFNPLLYRLLVPNSFFLEYDILIFCKKNYFWGQEVKLNQHALKNYGFFRD